MRPLFEIVVDQGAKPQVDADGPLQMQISALDTAAMRGE